MGREKCLTGSVQSIVNIFICVKPRHTLSMQAKTTNLAQSKKIMRPVRDCSILIMIFSGGFDCSSTLADTDCSKDREVIL